MSRFFADRRRSAVQAEMRALQLRARVPLTSLALGAVALASTASTVVTLANL